ncbi:MAG: phosphonate ABC transporter, permease protein PhnE [Alphaproteobacteria bacterium]|nr:phosphonate ABC transporter, permease protein PhnE [Alphaproteobacteria bacterium]
MKPGLAGRFAGLLMVMALVAPLFLAWHLFGVSLAQLGNGFWKLGQFAVLMFPPTPGRFFWLFLQALGETLAIALLGTLGAAVVALPFSLLAAHNITPFAPLRFLVKRSFDIIRSIDTLIWALIWIGVVGLGPFAGVLAILTSDIGALGKLFTETFEEADQKPVEGIRSSGGNRTAEFVFAIWPQVSPVILGQILYFFESNTRSATIIGVVGAGGIGLHLYEEIRTLEWQMVAFIVLMILVTVAVIDFISVRICRQFTGYLKAAS